MEHDQTWAIRMPAKLRERCLKAGGRSNHRTPAAWARRVLDEAARKVLGLKKPVLGASDD